MANKEHLGILDKGKDEWNDWRKENPEIKPDLSGIDITEREFHDYNFANTDFNRAWMTLLKTYNCNFTSANLANISAQGSYWRNGNFFNSYISGDLVGSNFYVANFAYATIEKCGIVDAELRFIKFDHSTLSGYFSSTHVNSWTIIDSDISGATFLSLLHETPTNIDFKTLQKTAKNLKGNDKIEDKISFFIDCGMPSEIISLFKDWVNAKSISKEFVADFYSCFISYNHNDKEFVKILHKKLKESGIQCWLDEHQVLPGDDILEEIDNGIRKWDKVLLCCSEHSLNSPWVDREIEKALLKEEVLWRRNQKKTYVIIPLNLDDYLFKWESGKSSIIKSRLAADFTNWIENDTKMNVEVERIIQSLKTNKSGKPNEPISKL